MRDVHLRSAAQNVVERSQQNGLRLDGARERGRPADPDERSRTEKQHKQPPEQTLPVPVRFAKEDGQQQQYLLVETDFFHILYK